MNSVIFNKGVGGSGTYKFPDYNEIEILKVETKETTYSLAIELFSQLEDQTPVWRATINDEVPYLNSEEKEQMVMYGTQKLAFKPAYKGIIEMEETDSLKTAKVWIDISKKPYTVKSSKPNDVESKIQAIINRALTFKPNDNKAVKKIFFNNDRVLLFISGTKPLEPFSHSSFVDIYGADKDNPEFTKYTASTSDLCYCHSRDSEWVVKDPKDNAEHKFGFLMGSEKGLGHQFLTHWDEFPLEVIEL